MPQAGQHPVSSSVPAHFGEKRYYPWNRQLQEHFGRKVMKITLDGGFDCPNRDGTVAYGGCTFCSQRGSGDFAGKRGDDLVDQFYDRKSVMERKWSGGACMAYFQAFTNTHAPLDELKEKYEALLKLPETKALSIATRPDCLPDDVVEYLAELNERTYLWVELGLQSAFDETGERINRAHDFACFQEGVRKLRKHGIRVCVHLINGLPGETHEMMVRSAEAVSALDIQGMKIHLLHLLKKTPMVKQFEQGEVQLLGQEAYIQIVCDQLERIRSSISIHRLTGDGPAELLIGPMWSSHKWAALNGIDAELRTRQTWQGIYAKPLQEGRS
ncbi:TIGR01212 family radical SAM protein [Alkalicoccus luteus]|uniref:TIGR01212 family radical SAM protein n=1 Tax=Alkalicoccus luteus TaxID=1237094 RepID=UPI004034F0FB